MINNPLNDSEEDVVIEEEEDEESGMTAIVAAEMVTRVSKNGVNRENGIKTERRSTMTVRSDATRNAGGGRGVSFPLPPLNDFQICIPRTHNSTSNTTTPAVSDVMQFLLMRAETDAQQQRQEHDEAMER